MAQRDFILRMIEQIGQMLIALRRQILRQSGESGDVEQRFRAVASHAGLDFDLIRRADVDTLVLLAPPQIDPSRCWALAELLYLDGLNEEAHGQLEQARASWQKAVRLYALIQPAGALLVGWPEAADRIADIAARLEALETDPAA